MRRLAPRSLALLLVALPWLAACADACAPDIKGTAGADAGAPAPSATPAREGSPLPLALRPVTDLRPAEGGLHADAPGLTDVAAWLQAELSKAPEFAAPGDEARPSARLSGDYRAAWSPAQDGSPGNLGAVYFELTLRTASPKGRPLDVYRASAFVGERLPDDKPPAEGLKLLVQGVTQEVAATLVKQVRAQHADDPALLSFLQTRDDVELLKPSIEEARRRRLRAATPGLRALLTHEDRDVVNLAAAALGDVGDRSVVPSLIDAGSRVSPPDRLPVIYALGELGGPEATLYLESLAQEPLDLALKSAVERALTRAKRPQE